MDRLGRDRTLRTLLVRSSWLGSIKRRNLQVLRCHHAQNDSGQTLDAKNVGRVMINHKSYKLHVTRWSNGETAVIVLNSRQSAAQLFSFDFFGKRTSGLQSLSQSKQTKPFTPAIGYAYQITPSGSVIESWSFLGMRRPFRSIAENDSRFSQNVRQAKDAANRHLHVQCLTLKEMHELA